MFHEICFPTINRETKIVKQGKTMKKRIAITGGIGSGKSTICKLLQEKGYFVVSCDAIYASVIKTTAYIQKIKHIAPDVIQNGEIDRKLLAAKLFQNDMLRDKVNAVAHPQIMEELFCVMDNAEEELTFAEVPLLLENGYEDLFDGIIVVLRDEEQRIAAVKDRDGKTEQEIRAAMRAQFLYDENNLQKLQERKPTFLIKNVGDLSVLQKAIQSALQFFGF